MASRLGELGREIGNEIFGSEPAARNILSLINDQEFQSGLEVRLDVDPVVPWVPWEALVAPGSDIPLSLAAASFLRRGDGQAPGVAATQRHEVLRVLVVVARPAGEDDVPFRSVASRIVHAAARAGGTLAVNVLRPATFAALDQALSAAAAAGTPYDVVHFDGHGVYRVGAFSPVRRGYLRLESAAGGPEDVGGRAVGELLVRHGVGILLLNACRSAFAADAAPGAQTAFGSLATDALAAAWAVCSRWASTSTW